MTRVATTLGEAEADEDGRDASSPQQNWRIPCEVCGETMERRDRYGFSGWAVHPMCALNTAEGASDAGEDRFGIEVIGKAGRSRRCIVHLVDFLPQLHIRIDGAASGGGGQQLRIARLWENVTPGTGDEGDGRDGGWRLRGRPVVEARDEPCGYCGRALDDPIDGLGGMNAPLQVPCDHGGGYTADACWSAHRIACGSADPRPCIACQSEKPLGRRPPHPVELAGAMATNEEEPDGIWPRTFEALRFSTIVGQELSQLDQTEYQSTAIYNTFEDMLRAQGHCVTASFVPVSYTHLTLPTKA